MQLDWWSIGLQLHSILGTVASRTPLVLIGAALILCLTVIGVHIAWVIIFDVLSPLLRRRLRSAEPLPHLRNVVIVAWMGMRGGLSLAAALALPLTSMGGSQFPERDLVIFLTFCVILATLVGQGLSLTPLIKLRRPR